MTLNYTTGKLKDKKLCEVVMPGTHDAAMNTGGDTYKTQTLDIYNQAMTGVRVFDLRIREHKVGRIGSRTKELAGFHGEFSMARQYGMTLDKILDDSKKFVENTNEFVILKFDHCEGWDLIANAIKQKIPAQHRLANSGNLNLYRMQQLKKKVIPVFASSGKANISPADGIYEIRNLVKGKKYEDQFQGMQYFGKGLAWGRKSKSSVSWAVKNQQKKLKIMTERENKDLSDTLGMIYWTTIAASGSIETRTKDNWNDPSSRLDQIGLFRDWIEQSVDDRVSVLTKLNEQRRLNNIPAPPAYRRDMQLRSFMPNIVMMDFAGHKNASGTTKCDVIYDLNDIAAHYLRRGLEKLVGQVGDLALA